MDTVFLTDKLRGILPRIREFVKEEIIPLETKFLHSSYKELEQRELAALRLKVKAEGLWAPHLDERDGGLGLTLTEFGQVSEELGRSPMGHYVFNCQAPDIGNMELLHKYASPALRDRYLHPLMQGQLRSCFSMTEPEFAGSNPVRMATKAEKVGGNYVINGHKWFTSSADGASFAVVMAVTNPEAPAPHARASMIIVPTETPGFELVRNIPIMGEAGSGHNSHAEVRYTNCTVPLDHLVGKEGEGFKLAQERLGPGRIHHCMRWIGICERAFGLMCAYVAERELAESVLVGQKQIVQQWIAESRAQINAARFMVLHAAHGIDHHGSHAMRVEISTIKFFVANVLQQVIDRAIQALGGLGITEDTILSFWYRHERAARIYDGPDEVHKHVVAREELKPYGVKL
jgi:alkylation response protein AidB-like acyl-CoA dehydrogenase